MSSLIISALYIVYLYTRAFNMVLYQIFLSISRWNQSITGRIHVLQTNYYVNSEQEWWVSYRSWIFTEDFLHLINSSWCLKYCIGIYSLQNSLWTEYWIIYLVSIHLEKWTDIASIHFWKIAETTYPTGWEQSPK